MDERAMIHGTVALGVVYLVIAAAAAIYYNDRLAVGLVLGAAGLSYLCQAVSTLAIRVPELGLLSVWLWSLAMVLSIAAGVVAVAQ